MFFVANFAGFLKLITSFFWAEPDDSLDVLPVPVGGVVTAGNKAVEAAAAVSGLDFGNRFLQFSKEADGSPRSHACKSTWTPSTGTIVSLSGSYEKKDQKNKQI